MKRISAGKYVPAATICWGILALVLRWQLYRTGVDAKGLLVRHHPLGIALMVLTVGVLIRILLAVRKPENGNVYGQQDSAGLAAAIGNVAAGSGILVTVLAGNTLMGGYLESAWRILGLTAPVCLFLAGAAKLFGKRPYFLLYVVPCLFFLAHIVTRYQLWSSDPQLQDYVFALLGAMALMLFGYYTAAQEAGCGNRQLKRGVGLASLYLCLAELARSSCPGLYLGGFFWVLTDLCSIRYASENETK